jgi:O-antigen/teichoic acid export membrane protein
MGIAVALVHVITGIFQVFAWRKKASHVCLSPRSVDYGVFKSMARYCSLQSLWTFGMLCVAGLDITIVGHYDYVQTAYYSIATLPTNFMLLIIAAIFNPLLPASSAMSTQRSASQMGDFLARITRYTTVTLLLTGLPLMVYGFPLLRFWVGPAYAFHTFLYLRILVFANIIRNLCAPYATMIVATDRQGAATASVVSEAAVNLASSIYLASRFGAIGVAIGTVLGSFVSVLLHFAISMQFSRHVLTISRSRLFFKGLLQPAMIVIPSLLILPLWWAPDRVALSLRLAIVWGIATLGFAWFGGLNRKERTDLIRLFRNGLMSLP